MSHIHIPDGILPVWILLLGWLLTALLLFLCIKKVKKEEVAQKLPYIGMVSAIMILAMMIEIVPIAYHFNLSVIAGIILGPALAFISVFIVDMIIAMFGHGGVTVVGLNTLVIGLEAAAGFYLFHMFLKILKNKNSRVYSASIATICSLILSTLLMISFISSMNLSGFNESDLRAVHSDNSQNTGITQFNMSVAKEINIYRFSKTVVFMSLIGWLLEALMSGFIIQYLYRINPQLLSRD
jgi:cobalt/nickel transport system permease protein